MFPHGWRKYLDLVFPRSCALCRSPEVDDRMAVLCTDCCQGIPPISEGCWKCGAPSATANAMFKKPEPGLYEETVRSVGRKKKSQKKTCKFCERQEWALNRVFAYTVYTSEAARATRFCKDSTHEPLAKALGGVLCDWLAARDDFLTIYYDYVIPIPQHWFRRLTHRYHPASVYADQIFERMQIPVNSGLLRRKRWTSKQGLKTISERRENIRGAFEVIDKKRVQYRSFLLVDDVMTSGATLADAARALREAGARQVDAVVFARGVSAAKPGKRVEAAVFRPDATSGDSRLGSDNLVSDATVKQLRHRLH